MAINDISLTAGMRSNLISLQGTVDLLNRTQERLSTGKKVNTALDNPLNYFTAKALNSKAADLAGYKDGMSEAVQTIKAANAGITGLEGLIAQAKAVAATALGTEAGGGDTTQYDITLANINNGDQIKIGNSTYTAVSAAAADQLYSDYDIQITSLVAGSEISIGGVTFVASDESPAAHEANGKWYFNQGAGDAAAATALKAAIDAAKTHGEAGLAAVTTGVATDTVTVSKVVGSVANWVIGGPGGFTVDATTEPDWTSLTATEFKIETTIGATAANLTAKANNVVDPTMGLNADNTDGVLVTSNGAVLTITIGDADQDTEFNVAARNAVLSGSSTVEASVTNDVRAGYAEQFVRLMEQFDNLTQDSGYKGINLLNDANLDVDFGNGHSITVEGFDASATVLVGASVAAAATNEWATDGNINAAVTGLDTAIETLKARASDLSSGLSITNTRQDWVKNMVNTLTQGADNLTLADMNEEGANMLMLQTRQTLGTTALSLSAQAAQSVLRLFA